MRLTLMLIALTVTGCGFTPVSDWCSMPDTDAARDCQFDLGQCVEHCGGADAIDRFEWVGYAEAHCFCLN